MLLLVPSSSTCAAVVLTLGLGRLQLFMLFMIHANGGRIIELKPVPKLYMDGPWRLQWPCMLLWVLLQIPASIAWLRNVSPGQMLCCAVLCDGFCLCDASCLYLSLVWVDTNPKTCISWPAFINAVGQCHC